MCAWQKSSEIAQTQLNRRGLKETVTATKVCLLAEEISPIPITAVSYRNTTLKIRVKQEDLVSFKLVQGKVIEDLNTQAQSGHFTPIKRLLIDIEL